MVQASSAVNKQTTAIGVTIRRVIVEQVVEERGVAIVRDAHQYMTEIRYRVQAGRGRMPRVGDYWYVDRSMGDWTFLAYIAKNDSDMTTFTEATNFDEAVTINGPLFVNNDLFSNASIQVVRAHFFDTVYASRVEDDGFDRFRFSADGALEWGPGNVTQDTKLHRLGPGNLRTDARFESGTLHVDGATDTGALTVNGALTTNGTFTVSGGFTAGGGLTVNGAAEINGALHADGDVNSDAAVRSGTIMFAGSSFHANGPIDTDASLHADGLFDSQNFPPGAWQNHTPAWTTSTGAHTPTFGNSTATISWTRLGRLIVGHIDIAFGSTVNFNAGTFADNWRFSLPAAAQAAATANCIGFAEVALDAGARCMTRILLATTGTVSLDVCSGTVDGISGTSTGIVDAVTPWTWTTTGTIKGEFKYQATTDF